MQMKRYPSLVVGVLFLGLAVALWAMPAQEPQNRPNERVPRVELGIVNKIEARQTAAFSGVTRSRHRAVLSFTVPARVVERRVEAGERVREGDVLARLDDREFRNALDLAQASVAECEAQYEQAGRDRQRLQRLADDDVVPVSELERVSTRESALAASLEAARARLKEARRRLDETVLEAPFGGTIAGLHIQAGEWAVPGRPAFELTGDGEVELQVEVPEATVSHLHAGLAVTVELPFAGGRKVAGRITSVAHSAMGAGRLFPVVVDLDPDPGITAGLTARLRVELTSQGVLAVPLAAVVNPGASQPYLFLYRQGRVIRRSVEVSGIVDDRIIVNGAIAEGDRVVTSGQSQLADGDRVEEAS